MDFRGIWVAALAGAFAVYDVILRSRSIWIRAGLCFVIALSFCVFEGGSHFDWRFRLRGEQKRSDNIVLVYFDQDDWSEWHGQSRNLIRSLKEFSSITDSFYWNPMTWRRLLGLILEQNPSVIGVSFFFSPDLPMSADDHSTRPFTDPRVVWAAHLD